MLAGADGCFHLASAVGVQLILENSLESLRRNTRGMETVIEAAAALKVRLLVASTSEIYGKSSEALSEDSDRVLGAATKSRWTYANAKVHGEMLAYGYAEEHGAENIVVRFFNTVGPRQQGMYGMVVPRFVSQALDGEDITIYGDGTQSRCFTHVKDSIDAMLRLIDCDEAIGRPFNVGSHDRGDDPGARRGGRADDRERFDDHPHRLRAGLRQRLRGARQAPPRHLTARGR